MKAKELQKYIDVNFPNNKHKRSVSGNVAQFAKEFGVSAQSATNWLMRDKVPAWVEIMIKLRDTCERMEKMLL